MSWESWDTAIVLTAAMAAMSCTLPGIWLLLREKSMMGDALSHTALPGVVMAFLFSQSLVASGWISSPQRQAFEPLLLSLGAIAIGVLTAFLTEWIQKLGNVESSAALGVVFTSLFALGLLLIRLKTDEIHLDPDCVLFGQLELVIWQTVSIAGWELPMAFVTNGVLFLINLLLLCLFYKELRVSAFDPGMADSLGISASVIHYALMAVTATTVVLAFESVGSILVVALLIVPAACGLLLCERLWTMISVSLGIAALSAVLGHVFAKVLPAMIFPRLGFPQVEDARTSGMIAVTAGMFFCLIFLFSPRNGLLGRWMGRLTAIWKMAADDILATLYRFEEQHGQQPSRVENVKKETSWIRPMTWRFIIWKLRQQGLIEKQNDLKLTSQGSEQALLLVRSHRLWEAYLEKHFELPNDHFHESAHLVEHYLDHDLRTQLDEELDSPATDPHGKSIPEQ